MASRFKKNGIWQIKYKDTDRIWKSVSCGRSASATDAETIRQSYDAQELNRKHKMTVKLVKANLIEQLEKYRDDIIPLSGVRSMRPKSKKTIKRYQALINNFIEFCNERNIRDYKEVSDDNAKDFLNHLINLKRSASTITKHRQTLINFFDWSIRLNYCQEQPFSETANPKKVTNIPRFFSEEELSKIFANSKQPYKDIFKFLYLTGVRTGECGNAEIVHFDKKKKELYIPPIEGNKTKDLARCIAPVNKSACRIIENQKTFRDNFNTPDSKKYIFVNKDGNKLDNDNIYRACKVVLRRCEIDNAKPHTFRHTCASHLVINGVSLYVVRDILRHASIRETEIYAHLSKEAVRGAIELLSVV